MNRKQKKCEEHRRIKVSSCFFRYRYFIFTLMMERVKLRFLMKLWFSIFVLENYPNDNR